MEIEIVPYLNSPSTFEKIFFKYSNCRPARPQDEEELLKFINSQPMKTKNWSLSFKRGDDYLSFYRLNGSGSFFPFVMTNANGSICGSSGLIRMSTTIHAQPRSLGYLCDLRVDPKAPVHVKAEWRSIFLDFLRELPQTKNPKEHCDFFVTSVFDTNKQALSALTKRLKKIRYLPLQRYRARSLLFHPWPNLYKKIDRHLHIETSPEIDLQYVKDWLNMNSGAIGLPLLSSDPSIYSYLSNIKNHWKTHNHFPVIKVIDEKGKKLGACWPWLGSKVRAPVVHGLSPSLSQLGKWISILGRAPIIDGEPMSQVYLTHMMIHPGLPKEQKHKVLRKMIMETYQLAVQQKVHLVTWVEGGWPAAPHAQLREGIIFDLPATMYQVLPEEDISNSYLLLPRHSPLYLEGASL